MTVSPDMMSPAIAEIVQRMPKAELHCHLDGSLRAATLLELSKARGLTLPHHNVVDLARWMRADETVNLEDYLARFTTTLAVMQTAAELERIAHELVLDAALDGVRYIEVRFCPALNNREGLSLPDVMDAVLKGLVRGERETGTLARVIVCALRSFPWPHAMEMAELAVSYKDRGVVAFDLAGGELGNAASVHAAAFDFARANNLAVTVHAGEGDGAASIHEAVHRCGAIRIGHGTRLQEDPDLERWVVDRQIPLEVCPTSNVQTRVTDTFATHPLARYVALGAVVTINTDNRLISGVTLSDEYLGCARHLGYDLTQLGKLAVASFGAAFLPLAERHRLQHAAEREIALLIANAPTVEHQS
ncbi:MAG: adenosine deaminase [Gemmatimonadaceae bacterium]|nr:adenosine deaminase [Gemmatimonadaceae bacterium]